METHNAGQSLHSVIPLIMHSKAGTVYSICSQMNKELNKMELQLLTVKNEFDARIIALRHGMNFLAVAAEVSVGSGVEELE